MIRHKAIGPVVLTADFPFCRHAIRAGNMKPFVAAVPTIPYVVGSIIFKRSGFVKTGIATFDKKIQRPEMSLYSLYLTSHGLPRARSIVSVLRLMMTENVVFT